LFTGSTLRTYQGNRVFEITVRQRFELVHYSKEHHINALGHNRTTDVMTEVPGPTTTKVAFVTSKVRVQNGYNASLYSAYHCKWVDWRRKTSPPLPGL